MIGDSRADTTRTRLVSAQRSLPQQWAARFELRSPLGEGGQGDVFEAYDRLTRRRVALKTLHRMDSSSRAALRRNFADLRKIRHRNLVQLLELLELEGELLVVMEAVPGRSLLQFVRPLGNLCLERLYECLEQLAEGLVTLHAAGHVHRDVKPQNVRVTPDGRAVLLDFGLSAPLEMPHGFSSVRALSSGTPEYMAPEQGLSEAADVPADWYALGALLYHALTGQVPFEGEPTELLIAKQGRMPISPQARVDEVLPPALCTLCMQLLSPRPVERPSGPEVLAQLAAARGTLEPSPQRLPGTLFPSCRRPLARLRRALDVDEGQGLRALLLQGAPGTGKTHVLHAGLAELLGQQPDAWVLIGQCRADDGTPHAALHGPLRQLASHLRELSTADLCRVLPPQAGLLPLVFPCLGQVHTITQRTSHAEAPPDPLSLRCEALASLRQLLQRLGRVRTVVLCLENIEHIDLDSLQVLQHLLRGPGAPRLKLICTTMGEQDTLGLAETLGEDAFARVCFEGAQQQASLGHDTPLRARLGALLGSADPTDPSLEAAARALRAALPPAAWKLLSTLALSRVALSTAFLRDLSQLTAHQFHEGLRDLLSKQLVTLCERGSGDTLALAHEALRHSLMALLDAADRRTLHLELASSLRSSPPHQADAAHHYAAAGLQYEAASAWLNAAERAFCNHAYHTACRLFGRALAAVPGAPPAEVRVLVQYGTAQSTCGDATGAATTYLQAAELASPAEALCLRRQAMEWLLEAGDLDRGLELARSVLSTVQVRLPDGRARATATTLWHMGRKAIAKQGFVSQPRHARDPALLVRSDLLYAAASRLGACDPFLAAALQPQHFLAAQSTGDPAHMASALSMDAMALCFSGRIERAPERIEQALALLQPLDEPDAEALVHYMDAQTRYFLMDCSRAYEAMTRACRILSQRCAAPGWLRDWSKVLRLAYAADSGRWSVLLRDISRVDCELATTGCGAASYALRTSSYPICLLAQDRPALAERVLQAAQPHCHSVEAVPTTALVRASLALYRGEPDATAWVRDVPEQLRKHGLNRIPQHAVRFACQIAKLHLRAGASVHCEAVRHAVRTVRRHAKSPAMRTHGAYLAAIVNARRGKHEEARKQLRYTEQRFVELGLGRYALSAKLRRAELVVGAERERLLDEIRAQLGSLGVQRPLRFVAALDGIGPLQFKD